MWRRICTEVRRCTTTAGACTAGPVDPGVDNGAVTRTTLAIVVAVVVAASCSGPAAPEEHTGGLQPSPVVQGATGSTSASPIGAPGAEASPAGTPANGRPQPQGSSPSGRPPATLPTIPSPSGTVIRVGATPVRPVPAPAPRASLSPVPLPSTASAQLTGVLGFDTIEGGCGYVETADGTRYEVIYPNGWQIDTGTERLMGPGGISIRAGQKVILKGAVTDEVASICQIGPLFRATEVVPAS